jgi:hypothetical protein
MSTTSIQIHRQILTEEVKFPKCPTQIQGISFLREMIFTQQIYTTVTQHTHMRWDLCEWDPSHGSYPM